MRDVMIGQYYHGDSLIHRIDPRVKLFATVIFLIGVFLSNNVGIAISAAFLITIIILSQIPVLKLLKSIKGVLFLMIITDCFIVFHTEGDIIFRYGIIIISWDGIYQALIISFRLIFLVISSSILTLSTTPNDLTDGIEKSCGLLKYIKVPVHEIAMMMSISMRFIPILMEETDKIRMAQMARGADFYEGRLIEKAKGMIPLIIPLVVSAMNRAVDLATAMEARCYRGGENRTKMKPLKYHKRDAAGYICIVVYFAAIVTTKILIK